MNIFALLVVPTLFRYRLVHFMNNFVFVLNMALIMLYLLQRYYFFLDKTKTFDCTFSTSLLLRYSAKTASEIFSE